MAGDEQAARPLDLWSLLQDEHEGLDPPRGGESQEDESPATGGSDALPGAPAPAPSAVEHLLDWQAALARLRPLLEEAPARRAEHSSAQGIAPEQVCERARAELPEVWWRTRAFLDQIPPRGGISIRPVRLVAQSHGVCDLCGGPLADPQHFPPRCALCVMALRLALGFTSLSQWLSGG